MIYLNTVHLGGLIIILLSNMMNLQFNLHVHIDHLYIETMFLHLQWML